MMLQNTILEFWTAGMFTLVVTLWFPAPVCLEVWLYYLPLWDFKVCHPCCVCN